MELSIIQQNLKSLKGEYIKKYKHMNADDFFKFYLENEDLLIKLKNLKHQKKITKLNQDLFNFLYGEASKFQNELMEEQIYYNSKMVFREVTRVINRNMTFGMLINSLKRYENYSLDFFSAELIDKIIELKYNRFLKEKQPELMFAPIKFFNEVKKNDNILNMHLKSMPLFEILNFLFKNNSKINGEWYFQINIMKNALETGSKELVEWLITKGMNPNLILDEERMRPLNRAIKLQKLELVKTLINLGADINSTDIDGNGLIHWAVATGNAKFIEELLKIAPFNVIAKNNHGVKPLHWVALSKNFSEKIEITKILIKTTPLIDFDPKALVADTLKVDLKKLLFMELQNYKSKEFIEFLLEEGVEANSIYHKATPITTVIKAFDLEVKEILVKDISNSVKEQKIKNKKKSTLEALDSLIKFGADVNLKDDLNNLPISKAVENGDVNIVELLVNRGADFKVVDNQGNNLLHKAIEFKNEAVAIFLLKSGISSKAVNNQGESSNKLAIKAKMIGLIEEMSKKSLNKKITRIING